MNVEGLTRENVASHLQKFRLLKNPETVSTTSQSDKGNPSGSTAP